MLNNSESYFGHSQGAKRSHSLGSGEDSQRRIWPKEARINDNILLDRALVDVCISYVE